jgi:phage FluMu gp28-like protein
MKDLLCNFQKRWIEDPAPVAIGEKSRRIGWTWSHALKVTLDRIAGKGNYYHSSTDQTASVEFIDYCSTWATMANAIAKGGEVGLDEFAYHRDGRELYKAAHATALFWGHPLRMWSTHNGEGSYFNGLLKQARTGEMKASIHRVTILDAVADGIVERIIMRKKKLENVPAADELARREWLDELRSTCPDQQAWDEEYMCIPSSEANSLLTYELIRAAERTSEQLRVVEDPRQLRTNLPMYYGMDVGRQRDLTVICGGARVGDTIETRLLKTFAKTDYTTQEQYVDLLMRNGAKRICIDATGIGDMLAERLQQRYGKYRVEAVKFTSESKAGLAMPLVQSFEDHLIRIPSSPEIREDLHKVRKIVTSAGNVRFDAAHDEAGHADRFWALALMVNAMEPNKQPRRAPLEDKPEVLI